MFYNFSNFILINFLCKYENIYKNQTKKNKNKSKIKKSI